MQITHYSRVTTSLGAVALVFMVQAQPILTADAGPVPGHTIPMALITDVPEFSGGPACVWDFTSSIQVSTVDVELVAPSTAPGGASYPTATVAALAEGNPNVNFLKLGPDGLQTVGVYNGQTITYTDPLRTLIYPCTYLTTWTDTWQNNLEQGVRQFVTDGYGTLICEAGTIEGVLRIWSEYSSLDTVIGGMHYLNTIASVSYWSPSVPWPVATTTRVRMYVDGQLVQEQSGGSVIAEIPSAVHEIMGISPFVAAPNPATEIVRLECAQGLDQVFVSDATGREVMRMKGSGRTMLELPLHGLVDGCYMIRALDSRGHWHIEKLIKQ